MPARLMLAIIRPKFSPLPVGCRNDLFHVVGVLLQLVRVAEKIETIGKQVAHCQFTEARISTRPEEILLTDLQPFFTGGGRKDE